MGGAEGKFTSSYSAQAEQEQQVIRAVRGTSWPPAVKIIVPLQPCDLL